MKRRWFLFFFGKSISQRKGRIAIASASVTLAVAVVTGMLGITIGIRDKLGTELKAYGANIVVSAQKGDYLAHDAVAAIASIRNVEEVSGQVFGNAAAAGRTVEIIGLDISRVRDRGWRLTGNWPRQGGKDSRPEILAGVNMREMLNLQAGQSLVLQHETGTREFTVSGVFEKGGAEDSAMIMSLSEAWNLLGLEGKVSAILVRGRSGQLEDIVRDIKAVIPSASVKTLRQVAFAEESLLLKIQLLMALVTVVVLFATAISVASTMGANVLERREEIGLMKAIGATRGEISIFYRAEAGLIGLLGGAAGFVLGYLSAQAVSKGAFHSFVQVPMYLSLFSLGTGMVISLVSSYFPVRDAMKYNPAIILRGE